MFWNEVDGDDEEFNRIFGYGGVEVVWWPRLVNALQAKQLVNSSTDSDQEVNLC